MKKLLMTLKIFGFSLLLLSGSLYAGTLIGEKPMFNKVYRSDRVGDSYHFLLLTKNGMYYHLLTNKTNKLSAGELKSSRLLAILEKKQSWGKAFTKTGKYTIDKGKIYTTHLWNRINIISKNKIKYLNKTFYIQ